MLRILAIPVMFPHPDNAPAHTSLKIAEFCAKNILTVLPTLLISPSRLIFITHTENYQARIAIRYDLWYKRKFDASSRANCVKWIIGLFPDLEITLEKNVYIGKESILKRSGPITCIIDNQSWNYFNSTKSSNFWQV